MPVNDYNRSPLSWMPLNTQISYPQYLSLAALLERDILSGGLPVGTKLPPQRALADYLDINFTTVTRAYDLCREKGLIYGEVGRGTFVAPHPNLLNSEKPAIELGVVLGFQHVTRQIVEAARDVMTNRYCKDLFSYTERMGMAHQRSACVQWMLERGIETDIEHTTIFAGAQNAITTALLSLFRTGDILVTDMFTYSNLIHAAHLAHIRIIPVPGDNDGMHPDALDAICNKNPIRGIYLMPECANPTTITISESRRDALCDICKKHHLIIIEDDSSLFASKSRSFYSRLPEQTIYIAATTRHIAAGLRISFACYPEQYKKALMDGLYTTSIKASALDAEILSQLIVSGKADEILKEKSQLAIRANRIYKIVFSEDTNSTSKYPFFRVHPLNKSGNGPGIEQYILSQGIRVCHSYRFAVNRNAHPSFLRISLSSTSDLVQLEEGLRRLKEILSDSVQI